MHSPAGTENCTPLDYVHENIEEYVRKNGFTNVNKIQVYLLKLLQHSLIGAMVPRTWGLSDTFPNALSVGNLGGKVPNDQWIKELWHWYAVNLSGLQIFLSDYAVGPAARESSTVALYERPPPDDAGRRLCSMQKMRKPGEFV